MDESVAWLILGLLGVFLMVLGVIIYQWKDIFYGRHSMKPYMALEILIPASVLLILLIYGFFLIFGRHKGAIEKPVNWLSYKSSNEHHGSEAEMTDDWVEIQDGIPTIHFDPWTLDGYFT